MKNALVLLCILFSCSTGMFAQNCTLGATVGSTCTLASDGVLTIPAGANLMIEVD